MNNNKKDNIFESSLDKKFEFDVRCVINDNCLSFIVSEPKRSTNVAAKEIQKNFNSLKGLING
ncbi:MAG: hypothetical protein KN64_07870 [Sulfurovum sp. AS07-7]|nr:MAG: hypothetical protein KN64_07870 [Sulfurovum sp. AS07-7]